MRGGLSIHPKNQRWRYISSNCNKLKIIAQYISYNKLFYVFLTLYYGGGGVIRKGGLFLFSLKRGLIREGAYLREALNRENTVYMD